MEIKFSQLETTLTDVYRLEFDSEPCQLCLALWKANMSNNKNET